MLNPLLATGPEDLAELVQSADPFQRWNYSPLNTVIHRIYSYMDTKLGVIAYAVGQFKNAANLLAEIRSEIEEVAEVMQNDEVLLNLSSTYNKLRLWNLRPANSLGESKIS